MVKKAIGLMGFELFAEKFKNRFVAGSTLKDAVNRAKFFKQRGEKSVINILGEHLKDRNGAIRAGDQIIELMVLLNKEGLIDVHVAEKPSQIGLDVSEEIYRYNKFRILGAAQTYLPGGLVETDAEDHFYRERVFRIALHLNACYHNQLLCCQLNRRETIQEIKILSSAGIPVRLCKGNAYNGEFKKEDDLRKAFLALAPLVISCGKKSAFATHDLFLIDSIARKLADSKDRFEFELLMGIEENLRKERHLQGFTFRRYIPCDPDNKWRPYGKRRAEAFVNIWLRNWRYRVQRRREFERNTL